MIPIGHEKYFYFHIYAFVLFNIFTYIFGILSIKTKFW